MSNNNGKVRCKCLSESVKYGREKGIVPFKIKVYIGSLFWFAVEGAWFKEGRNQQILPDPPNAVSFILSLVPSGPGGRAQDPEPRDFGRTTRTRKGLVVGSLGGEWIEGNHKGDDMFVSVSLCSYLSQKEVSWALSFNVYLETIKPVLQDFKKKKGRKEGRKE